MLQLAHNRICRASFNIEHLKFNIQVNTLTPSERRALRARAHSLHPFVMVGNAGLTPAVLKEIDIALKSHELIKIRMLGEDRVARENAIDTICDSLDASPIQVIGKMLVVYRAAPEPEKKAPPAVRKKPPRRNKRSHQTRLAVSGKR